MAFDFSKIEDENLRKELEDAFAEASNRDGYFSQSEFDRKVNEIGQSYAKKERELERQIRKKVEDEALLNAEDKAKKILEEVQLKEAEVARKENRIEVLSKLTESGIDPKDVTDLLELFVSDDKDATMERVDKFITNHRTMETKIKEQLMKEVDKPRGNPDPAETIVDKAKFDSMSYSEKLQYKEENPDAYHKFVSGSAN